MGESPPNDDERFFQSIVEQAGDLIVVFTSDGTVVYINPASNDILGLAPSQVVGTNVLDYMHPDELERAIRGLTLNATHGSAPGATSYRLRHADGTWSYVDMTGGHAHTSDNKLMYTSFSRRANDRFAMSETLTKLVSGATLTEVLRPVCDTFDWQVNGSHIGISWIERDGGIELVHTGIDPQLVAGEEPWEKCRWSGEAIIDDDLSLLTDDVRQLAHSAGLGAYWIKPVPNPMGGCALVTVWTKVDGRPPIHHALAMETVPTIVEMILRWHDQQHQLDRAVYHDALTGVANRARLFEELDNCCESGSILYCDLDHFKAVNDTYGHAAGDELLKQFAERLTTSVRGNDLVARLGGDEFVVLCCGATPDIARTIAQRIETTVAESFVLEATTIPMHVSIGIAHDPIGASVATLNTADQRLYLAKQYRAHHALRDEDLRS